MSSTTTMGVRLDEATRERIKTAAQRLDRTPHWLIKQAIFNYLEQLDNQQFIPEISSGQDNKDGQISEEESVTESNYQPFLDFAEHILPQSVKRSAITSAYRIPETQALPMLLQQAQLPQSKQMPPISWLIPSQKNYVIKKMGLAALV